MDREKYFFIIFLNISSTGYIFKVELASLTHMEEQLGTLK